jgi:peptide/nickel transport system permease protein
VRLAFWRPTGSAYHPPLSGLARAPKLPLAIIFIAGIAALFAPVLAPHDPTESHLILRLRPPPFLHGGDPSFLLGTDGLGRDILSRIIFGARVSLAIAVTSILIGALVGIALGLLAGYRGGLAGAVLMGTVDVSLAFPTILLALVLAVTVGPSFGVVVAIISFSVWSRYARLVRGEVLSLKERDFVSLARISGCSPTRIVLAHILPNVVNSIVVLSSLSVGHAIISEGFLSFLGAGIPPPTPSWGGMIAEGRNYIQSSWWMVMFPGLAIALVVLSFNLVGDWIRDELDPQLRQL